MLTAPPGYQLREEIGRGGSACVYRAVQESLRREVAIKFLGRGHCPSNDIAARFRREALAATAVNHRNVVTIYDCGQVDELFFIVMEYVDGFDLKKPLAERLALPPELALMLAEEIACGLKVLHERGILHRDVKPGNVLVGRNGDVKISDFGIARSMIAGPDWMRDLTLGLPVGTPPYMSPEQAQGLPVDARTDVFSLAVLIQELLTGKRPGDDGVCPFETESRPDPVVAELGVGIEAMRQHAMARAPESRTPSMRAMIEEIGTCLSSLDPSGRLARRRHLLLEQFGSDRAGLVARCAELHLPARLCVYENLALEVAAAPSAQPAAAAGSEPVSGRPIPPVAPEGPAHLDRRATTRRSASRHAGLVPRLSGAAVLMGLLGVLIFGVRTRDVSTHKYELEAGAIDGAVTGATLMPSEPAPTWLGGDGSAVEGMGPVADLSARETQSGSAFVSSPGPAAGSAFLSSPAPASGSALLSSPGPASESAFLSSSAPASGSSFVRVVSSPPGDLYVDDEPVLAKATAALVRIPAAKRTAVTIRHPDLFGTRTWFVSGAPGDTLSLGTYEVRTGVLRVACKPEGPGTVRIAGQRTTLETPALLKVAEGRHLVKVDRADWAIQKVVVVDRTEGSLPREIVASEDELFSGVPVDVVGGHDYQIVFYGRTVRAEKGATEARTEKGATEARAENVAAGSSRGETGSSRGESSDGSR